MEHLSPCVTICHLQSHLLFILFSINFDFAGVSPFFPRSLWKVCTFTPESSNTRFVFASIPVQFWKKKKQYSKKRQTKKTIHTKNPKIHIQEKHRMQQSFFSDFLTELWLFWSWAPDMSSKKKTYRFIAWHKGNMSLCMRNASEILIFTVYTYCKLKGNKQNGHQNNTMGTHKT